MSLPFLGLHSNWSHNHVLVWQSNSLQNGVQEKEDEKKIGEMRLAVKRKTKMPTDAHNGNNYKINESVKNNFILFSDILIIR